MLTVAEIPDFTADVTLPVEPTLMLLQLQLGSAMRLSRMEDPDWSNSADSRDPGLHSSRDSASRAHFDVAPTGTCRRTQSYGMPRLEQHCGQSRSRTLQLT